MLHDFRKVSRATRELHVLFQELDGFLDMFKIKSSMPLP